MFQTRSLILALCVVLVFLTACQPAATPSPDPLPAATPPAPLPTPFPAPTLEPPPTAPPAPVETGPPATLPVPDTPAATVIVTPDVLPATVTPPPGELSLAPPLLVESATQRLYAGGTRDGRPGSFALDAANGRLLRTYPVTGTLAVDALRGRLFADSFGASIHVLDVNTGQVLPDIALPAPTGGQVSGPALLFDDGTNRLLAFRGPRLYVIDAGRGVVVDTIPFTVTPAGNDCRTPGGEPLWIADALLDRDARILYLTFLSYVCTPWFGYTLLSFDLERGQEITRREVLPFTMATGSRVLFAADWQRFGIGSTWAWREGKPWQTGVTDWSGGLPDLAVDLDRGRVYALTADSLRVLDVNNLTLQQVVPRPVPGRLAGYDRQHERLYFVDGGRLHIWPGSGLQAPARPPVAAQLPARSVRLIVPSPAWPQERTLLATWDEPFPPGDCYAFNQSGGLLLTSRDGGQHWTGPAAGLPGCALVSSLAVSPDFAADRTILAGLVGSGLFRSTDRGDSWQPTSAGLPSMGIRQVLLSPGFTQDGTAFANVLTGPLQRSTDAGHTWHALSPRLDVVALSPEFEGDGILLGTQRLDESAGRVLRSTDRGDSWQVVGPSPTMAAFLSLSLAPLFAKWQVALAYSSDGTVYRTSDGGASWQPTNLVPPQPAAIPAQFVYTPGSEANRVVFALLVLRTYGDDAPVDAGTLFRSADGGQTWDQVVVPNVASPTALALSPDYARDNLLFIGDADGQVHVVRADELHR